MLLCHIFAVSAVSVIAITSDDVYQDSPSRPLPHGKPFAMPLPRRMTFAPYQLTVAARRIAISALAAFSSQAIEIKFYNVPTGMIQFGDSLYCRLEPTNRYHSNCIALWLSWPSMMLGHLAGEEAACHLAPLMRCGFVASR